MIKIIYWNNRKPLYIESDDVECLFKVLKDCLNSGIKYFHTPHMIISLENIKLVEIV